ncbi:DctP family TRAP transporter solute-binding subunit [Oscillospiraceae bacterium LTW-04]|nr:DctP family TRAP transporter solute-binding subunit [Oscillospiraceae bacterium MB24-C1]
MKRIIALILSTAIVLSLGACSNASSSSASVGSSTTAASADGEKTYDKVKLKMSCNGTDQANDTKTAKRIAQLVSERSNGAVQITVYNNDQLASGDMSKGLELVLDGTVDMDCHSTSIISNLDNRLMVSTLPWIFSDYQAAEDAFWGTGGEFIDSVLQEKGLTYLGAVHNGFKMMTSSKRLIKTPEDLKGLKMRIPGGEFFSAFYKAYGASPQAMSWSEVFSALQQGTIDGHDNSISTCVSNNIQEVQKYFTVSRHTYEAFTFMANSKKFAALSEDTQQLIRDCVEEACKAENQEIVNNESNLIKKCEDEYGCEFYELTADDIAAFRSPIDSLINEYKEAYGADACAAFNV